MSQWVFAAQPESFSINGFLGDTHVDEHDEVLLKYSGGRSADFTISLNRQLSNNLTIFGSSGKISIEAMFSSANKATLLINGKSEDQTEVLSVTEEFRENGFEYEIEEAVHCIQQGLTESPRMPHNDTLATMKLLDQLRKAIGLSYSFEPSIKN
jgi:predicted dehydrogenase